MNKDFFKAKDQLQAWRMDDELCDWKIKGRKI